MVEPLEKKLTSYNSQGISAIDYVLCSEEFMPNICKCIILPNPYPTTTQYHLTLE